MYWRTGNSKLYCKNNERQKYAIIQIKYSLFPKPHYHEPDITHKTVSEEKNTTVNYCTTEIEILLLIIICVSIGDIPVTWDC